MAAALSEKVRGTDDRDRSSPQKSARRHAPLVLPEKPDSQNTIGMECNGGTDFLSPTADSEYIGSHSRPVHQVVSKNVQLPHFPECNHSLIKALFHHSDGELVTLFQRHPECGRYFTAIFCRYYPIVYTLISHSAKDDRGTLSRTPVQADYLFALTWRHIYHELGGLDLRFAQPSAQAKSPQKQQTSGASDSNLTLQNWLIDMTAYCINHAELPPVESIYYVLQDASPPLWCYLEQALEQLPPEIRLMILMSQTFHWSETRISAYLQAEGETLSPAAVKQRLQEGYQLLENALPADIQEIYLEKPSVQTTNGTATPPSTSASALGRP